MNTPIIKRGLARLFLFAAFSCRSSVAPESLFDNQQSIWNCHHRNVWSAKKIAGELIGRWQWRYVSCDLLKSTTQNAGLEIVFNSDSTVTLWENGVSKQDARWKVVPTDHVWGLSVQPSISQLHGRILFCVQTLEFNDSYIDGCDNYFVRR